MASVFNITFITNNVARLGRFWAAALNMAIVEQRDDLMRLAAPDGGTPNLLLLHSDTPCSQTGRVHLDLAAHDVPAETQRLVQLGAELADHENASMPTTRTANGLSWVVLRDPDGNELCLGSYPDEANS